MCLAIVKKAGATVDESYLKNGFDRNGDGAGFAFIKDGKIEVVKGLMKWEEFMDSYTAAAAAHPDSPFLIHFRVGTSGVKGPANTHPFVGKECAVIHNGVMFHTGYTAEKSDTRTLIEAAADRLTKARLVANKDALERHVGVANKLCFLFPDGDTLILNEKQGEWHDNVWYSNLSFCGYDRNKIVKKETANAGGT